MAIAGFIFYGLAAFLGVNKYNDHKEQTYDEFTLQFKNGTIIAKTFTNIATICNWAHGILKYKNINSYQYRIELLPTKLPDDEYLTYTNWCRLD